MLTAIGVGRNLAFMFGDTLRKLRKAGGLTQVELATLAGISPATVIRLERGQNRPDLATLVKLGSALGVSPADLLSHGDQSAPAA